MAIREILAALGRRWYIVLIGVVLTIAGGWYAYNVTPPEYTARGLVLLLPPIATGEDAAGSNPFLQLGGLELTARVVVATYSSTAFAEVVQARSPDAIVEVSVDDSTRGGIILVEVTDSSEQGALDMLDYVTGDVSARLDDLQTQVGVSDSALVGSMLLTKDTEGTPDYRTLIRVLVIVVGGGLALTVVLAVTVDGIAGRAQRRRANGDFGVDAAEDDRPDPTAGAHARTRAETAKPAGGPQSADDLDRRG